MERHLYRFRTAERLLGTKATDIKKALPGELENLEIYFAPPEQLNDPLEGYKEIYWAGDEIIWRNFFRHYLLVLALRSWELDEAVRLGTPLPKNLPIEQYPSNLRGAFQAGYQEMDALIGGCDVIQGYVRALSKNEARHYRPELSFYLATLHTRLLSTVLLVNFKHGLSGVYPDQTPEDPLGDRDLHLQAISNIEAQDGTLQDAGSYEKMALLNATYAIRTAHVMPGGHIGVRELITAFVPHYLDQIERLMHPQWYVACFMKECSNSAIWGSYGDNHRGICLRYRVLGDTPSMTMEMNKPDGRGYNGISHSFQNMSFKEVFYDREFSEMDFFRFLGNVSNEALSGFWYSDAQGNLSSKSEWLRSHSNELWIEHHKNLDFALTSKLPQWGSEKEYRLVLSSYLDISDKKHRILKYRFTSLDGLIFGIKTPLEDKLKCIRIIRAHCEREDIKSFNFYQAYYDPQTKSIEHGLLPITLYEADPESEEPSDREAF